MIDLNVPIARRDILAAACLAAAAVVLAAVSLPALQGPLILDSVKLHSLEDIIHRYGDLAVLHTPSFGGDGTGRIVSMASFVLNGQLAGSLSPFDLKLTNVLIHLVNGALVLVLARLLAATACAAPAATLIAAGAAALWLLSPLNFNVTLYAVQRMTQLAALFTLAGLILYTTGRLHERRGVRHTCLALAVFACLPLAVLSKQNGALLVPLAYLVEVYLIHPLRPRLSGRQLALIGAAGACAAVALLFYLYPGILSYQSRDFTLAERLLSQPRALVSYLQHLLFPYGGDTGVFTDDFVVSRSLLAPVSTLPALAAVAAMGAFCVAGGSGRYRLPAFGLAFFLVGHLLESTVIPLEPYFLHRSYLPGLGVYLAAAWLLATALPQRRWVVMALCIGSAYFVAIDYARALTWSDRERIAAAAVRYHPGSPRALSGYAQLAVENGRFDTAIAANARAIELTGSLNHRLQRLYILCRAGAAIPGTEYAALRDIRQFGVGNELGQALGNLLALFRQGGCPQLAVDPLVASLDRLAASFGERRGSPWTILYYADSFLHASGDRRLAHRRLRDRMEAGHLESGLYRVELLLEENDEAGAAAALERLRARFPARRLQSHAGSLERFRERLQGAD